MVRLIILILLSAMTYSASAMDIEDQIIKIRNASDDSRYKLVNELKRELSKLSRNERINAIVALKQQMGSVVNKKGSNMSVLARRCNSEVEQSKQNGQHNILEQYPNIVSVENTKPDVTTQVTPQRPHQTIKIINNATINMPKKDAPVHIIKVASNTRMLS